MGLCPFHAEKTPSFHVHPERGFFHCFGCGASGDAIRFLQQIQGLPFAEAVRLLAERTGIEIVEVGTETERRQEQEQRRRRQELYDINNAAAGFFERMRREHPLAAFAEAELRKRGLVPTTPTDCIADTLQAFRVGYAPYSWQALTEHLRGLGFGHLAAETVGLLVPRRGGPGHYDRFRHRLMFAVLDLQGRVVAFSGRTLPAPEPEQLRKAGVAPLGTESRAAEAPAKYINSPESPVYQKRATVFGLYQARQALRETGRAIIVEGNFDVVSLHAKEIRNAVAPLGTALTAEQAELVRRLAPEATLLFDGDDAGRRAVHSARDAVRTAGLGIRVATLPQGADPDEFVRNEGPAALRRVIGAAKGLLEHLIDSLFEDGYSPQDAAAQAAKIQKVAELLATETDPTVRAMGRRYADQVAERLGIADPGTFMALSRHVRRALRDEHPSAGRRSAAPNRAYRPSDAVSREIFGCVLDHPELLELPELSEALGLLEGEIAAAMAIAQRTTFGRAAGSSEQLLAKLPAPIHSFAASRLAAPRHDGLDDARRVLLQNLNKLKRLEDAQQKRQTIEGLRQAAASGDFDAQLELLEEQMTRARQRHGMQER